MNNAMHRLLSLRVADAMSRDVVKVHEAQSMGEAAAIMNARNVAAAPVVNAQGRCVGFVSATDFLPQSAAGGDGNGPGDGRLPVGATLESGTAPLTEPVSAHMSTHVRAVAADAPLLTAARIMCMKHVHRLAVLDVEQRPVGVISTLDIIASLVNAVDEAEALEA